MTSFARHASALLLATLLAGCGAHGVPGAVKAQSKAASAKAVAGMVSRKPMRAIKDPTAVARLQAVGATLAQHGSNLTDQGRQMAEDEDNDATDATALSEGKGAKKADDVDALLSLVAAYGYDGDRKHLVQAIHRVVYQFPLDETDANSPYYAPKGWDPTEHDRLGAHFCYWQPNFQSAGVPVTDKDDYAAQSLLIAQSRIDVRYYIWVSKPAASFWPGQPNSQDTCVSPSIGTTDPNPFAPVMSYAPIYSPDTGFNIVKAVGDPRGDNFMVHVGLKRLSNGQTTGMIQDYFVMPSKFMGPPVDLGNLLPIPESLYF